jgi:parallel beta-helix repeat protein
VYVKQGTYNERVVPQSSGTAIDPIVFEAYSGHTVTIDGTGLEIPQWTGLVHIEGKSHIRVSGFRVLHSGPLTHNTGIQVEASDHITIENNYISDTASSGILTWGSSHIVVAGNEVVEVCRGGSSSPDLPFNECITIGETAHFEVRENYVHDCHKEGIDAKDGSSYGQVHGNHVHDTVRVGIYVDAADKHTHDIDVFGNRVHNIEIDGDGISVGSEAGGLLENIRIFNNLSYNNQWSGIVIHRCCEDIHPLKNIQILNNTVYNIGVPGGWGVGIGHANNQATGVVIRNNILSKNLSLQVDLEDLDDPGAVVIDHNLYDGPGPMYGTGNQVGDPSMVSPSSGDFHLQAGSLAIDTGTSVGAPSDDFDGLARDALPDIGAYEYRTGGSCTLSCSATVPATAEIRMPITFQGSATATGCSGAPTFDWDFGDGSQHSASQSPVYTYTSPGTFAWRMTVVVQNLSCTRSGSIMVTQQPTLQHFYLVPAIVHAPGVGGTQWRTDLAAVNRSGSPASLRLTYYSDSTPLVATADLDSGAAVEWRNVLESLFGIDSTAVSKGTLSVESTVRLAITSRTYNQAPDGTFGQYLPALTAAQATAGDEEGLLLQLRSNAEFRTNVGLVNLGAVPQTALVRLFGPDGSQLGSPQTDTVEAERWTQINDIFRIAGAGRHDLGYATVTVESEDAVLWAYASVIDNTTGDPTTIPVIVP